MHIPSEMLNGAVCPVSAVLALAGVSAAAYALVSGKAKAPSASRFALTSAAVFGLQMLNYPVADGISGHLIGGLFASAMLGVPAGVLSVSLVLLIQTLLFADGGILMLGANIVNMALLGSGLAGLIYQALQKRRVKPLSGAFVAGACSVMAAALALSAELTASGKGSAGVVGTLLGVHGVLALVEGVATVGLLASVRDWKDAGSLSVRTLYALTGMIAVSLAVAPFASAFPDAFEWTMERFSLLPDAPDFVRAPFSGYALSGVAHEALSASVAGMIGVAASALLAFALMRPLEKRSVAEA